MKKLLAIAGLMLAFSGINANAAALQPPSTVFSVGPTNFFTVLSSVIVPARSANNGIPVVTFLEAQTDEVKWKVCQYKVTEVTQCTFTNSTVSIPVTTTNTGTKWDTGYIVVRHMIDDTYEKAVLATSGGATNIEVGTATFSAVRPGDFLYKVSTNGMPSVTCVTNSVAANSFRAQIAAPGGIFVGQRGYPMLLEIGGTTAGANGAALWNASGYYAP